MRVVLVLLTMFTASSCGAGDGPMAGSGMQARFSDSDAILTVRIADSQDEQRQGLMGVDRLPPNRGMAFVYDEPTTTSFWMKDTLIPLSIAFVDERDRIISIEEMTPCTDEPCTTWDAGGAAYTLALEANAGWFADHGIEIGERVELTQVGHV
jgi:uncharacterized protein